MQIVLKRLIRSIEIVALLCVIGAQHVSLTYYLIDYFQSYFVWYLLYAFDCCVLVLFAIGSVLSRRHCNENDSNVVEHNRLAPLCWIVYAVWLSIKIFIVHSKEIATHYIVVSEMCLLMSINVNVIYLQKEELEWHAIKLNYACSAVVFVLWLTINKAKHIDALISSVVVELFDCVTLLDLIVPPTTLLFDSTILLLSCVNFALPCLALCRQQWTALAHDAFKLITINLPYLFIRIYLHLTANKELSIFLLKNVFATFLVVKSLLNNWQQTVRRNNTAKHSQTTDIELTQQRRLNDA